MLHTDNVDSADGSCLRTYRVEKADDFLLVGDGYVEPFEFGVGSQNLGQCVDGGYLKVDVLCVDVLVLK